MKIFKVDSQSWQQMDDRTTRPQIAMHTGIHDLTSQNIKNKSFEERAAVEALYLQNEAEHQRKHDIENNKYSANIENQTNIGEQKKNAHIDPTIGEYIENGMSTTANATGAGADVEDEDYYYEMHIPGTNKTLHIYSKKQHKDLTGGLIIPEEESNTASIVSNESDIQTGAGVSFSDDTNASGIAFNDKQ